MNDQLTDKEREMDKKLAALPEEIQNIIYSDGTGKTVTDIGEKYNLHFDKIEDLLISTEDVMSGDILSSDFVSHIKKTLEIDQEMANNIGKDINEQVFESVRDAIRSLSEPKQEEKETNIVKSKQSLVVKKEVKPTIADIKTKQVTSSPVQESSYSLDPYREPIE